MTIIERSKVLDAYTRAVILGADHEHACATVAQAFGLPPEAVHDVAAELDATTNPSGAMCAPRGQFDASKERRC